MENKVLETGNGGETSEPGTLYRKQKNKSRGTVLETENGEGNIRAWKTQQNRKKKKIGGTGNWKEKKTLEPGTLTRKQKQKSRGTGNWKWKRNIRTWKTKQKVENMENTGYSKLKIVTNRKKTKIENRKY